MRYIKFTLFVSLFFIYLKSFSQGNLLDNPSFEYPSPSTYPDKFAEVRKLNSWEDDMNNFSKDCTDDGINNPLERWFHSPDWFKYEYLKHCMREYPNCTYVDGHTGHGYVGMGYGELIEQNLSNSLINGESYILTAWIRPVKSAYGCMGTGGYYAIPNSNPVTFVANDYIELNPGFETYDGMEFEAYIDEINCSGSGQKISSPQYNPPTPVVTPSNKNNITKTDSVYFNLTPNPCKTFVQIEYSTNNDKNIIMEIYNIAGNKLKQFIYRGGKNTETLDISELTNGIYFYRATAENKVIAKDKIVVIK